MNPFEYVGRMKRLMWQHLKREVQETELHNFMKNPNIYNGNNIYVLSRYSPDSDRCKDCKNYLICDKIYEGLETGKIKIYIRTELPISMN